MPERELVVDTSEPAPQANTRSSRLKPTGTGVGQIILWIVAVIAFVTGIAVMVYGESATHEILAGVYFGISTLAIMGITITRAITRLR